MMAASRRLHATSIFKRIGALLGAPNLEVIWPDLDRESPFREAQMIITGWDTGLFKPEEVRPALAQRIRVPLKEGSKAPDDVLIPNTKGALKAAADAKPDPVAPGAPAKGKVGNKQGVATKVGKLSDGDNTGRDRGETG